jgi:RNA polymerase sigma-70 factor (ECF subfamily)
LKKASPSFGSKPSPVQALACQARRFAVSGHEEAARAAYDELVGALQRRASRIAFHYLRDADEADEAVQDAFVKAYVNLASYRENLPFDAWFTRIVVNGCLDRLKRRKRLLRWYTPWEGTSERGPIDPPSGEPSPEDLLVSRQRQQSLGEAISRLPDRQRTVVLLAHLDGRTPREVSAITGLNESTVRVHLFRAVRRLRAWLDPAASARESKKEA